MDVNIDLLLYSMLLPPLQTKLKKPATILSASKYYSLSVTPSKPLSCITIPSTYPVFDLV
jgi:hypothetical protein